MTERKIITVDWNDIMRMCVEIVARHSLRREQPILVGVSRGGLPLLTVLASYLKSREVGVAFSESTLSDEPFSERLSAVSCNLLACGSDITDRHVLVVDDMIRSGRTASAVIDAVLKFRPASIAVYAPFVEPLERSFNVYANRSIDEHTWVVFPWDNFDAFMSS